LEIDHQQITPENYLHHKNEVTHYIKRDVLATGVCFVEFARHMFNGFGYNPWNDLTISSLGYNIVMENISQQEEQPLVLQDFETDTFVRQAIVGGRVFIQKGYFQTQQYSLETIEHYYRSTPDDLEVRERMAKAPDADRKKIFQQYLRTHPQHQQLVQKRKAIYDSLTDCLRDTDAVSLYPSAMAKFQYPVGEGNWVTDLDTLKQHLNDHTYKNLSIVECDVTFPDKNIVMSLIPNREGERLTWDCQDHTLVLTSVDLMQAIKYNKVQITHIHRAFEWNQKAFIFKDIVETIFSKRKEAKEKGDNVMSNIYKLIMNSSYGKFYEKIYPTNHKIFQEVDNGEIDKLILEGRMVSMDLLGDFETATRCICEVEKQLDEKAIKRPSYLGAFILSYSKQIMNEYIAMFDGFDSFETTPLYGDTDSLFIHEREYQKLLETDLIGKDLGQLHNDLEGVIDGKIILGIYPALKAHYEQYIGFTPEGDYLMLESKRAKGINMKSCELKREDYLTMLAGQKVSRDQTVFKKQWIGKEREFGIEIQRMNKLINKSTWTGRELLDGHIWRCFGSQIEVN
jgi:hypothetical protein